MSSILEWNGGRTPKADRVSSTLTEDSSFCGLLVYRIMRGASNAKSGVRLPGGLPILKELI